MCFVFFFFNDTATTEIYTLSLHDALPISFRRWTEPSCNHLGFLLPIQQLLCRWATPWLPIKGDLKAFFHQTTAQILHGLSATVIGLCDAPVTPVGALDVGFEQYLGSAYFLTAATQGFDNLFKVLVFGLA